MKKVLIIGDLAIPTIENVEIQKVDPVDGMTAFLSEDWDVIIGYAEAEWDEKLILLKDIQRSLQPNQKVFRSGFMTGGNIPLLQLPYSIEEFKQCLE